MGKWLLRVEDGRLELCWNKLKEFSSHPYDSDKVDTDKLSLVKTCTFTYSFRVEKLWMYELCILIFDCVTFRNSFYISESHKIVIIKKKTSLILWELNNVAHLRSTGGCKWIRMQVITNINSIEPGPGEACPKETGSAGPSAPNASAEIWTSSGKEKSHHQAGEESCQPVHWLPSQDRNLLVKLNYHWQVVKRI